MATTDRTAGRTTEGASQARSPGRRTFTETKAGAKTSEFILTIAFIVGVLIAAYLEGEDRLGRDDGWMFATIALAAYVVSRGLAKLGVREPYLDEDAGR